MSAILVSLTAYASPLISRTITIDGNMGDWYTPTDITTNPGQFSEDCEGKTAPSCDLDFEVQSTGRDLKKFSYTWDNTYLYFYVERWASSTNTTNWLFYLDENANGLMESGERIFRVDWSGSNQRTNAYICPYFPDDPAGDPLVDPATGQGDGYTMPGSSANNQCQQLYSNVVAGSNAGTEMESRVAWSDLGLSGPQNILFHISSSRGMNLPSQVEDNMDGPGGPGGGGLFPPDMSLAVTADNPYVMANQTITFGVELTHIHFQDFSDIEIDTLLPAQLVYQSHIAEPGTSFVDTTGDGVPDQWQVPELQEDDVFVLQITAQAQQIPFATSVDFSATISDWVGDDSNPDNNSDTVNVEIRPIPELSITKVSSTANADPGTVIRYQVYVSNPAGGEATDVQVNGSINRFTSFRVNTFGAGQPFQFSDGATPSTLALGTPEYSDDGGATYTYTPVSGGGGAPAGYDANLTHWRIPMSGTMNGDGASFELVYDAILH